ncbi:MAG: thermonuclease family protein [Candidatus Omnitrophota bacterium]
MRDIIKAIGFIAVVCLVAAIAFSRYASKGIVAESSPIAPSETGKKQAYSSVLVTRVIDGDTLHLENGKRVRLIGIDTPEMHDSQKLYRDSRRSTQDTETIKAMGRRAYAFTRQLVEGKRVRLEFDAEKKDRYGRLLAYVYIDLGLAGDLKPQEGIYYTHDYGTSIFVNASIVASGYADLMTYPPNVKYADLFLELYRQARDNNRGLWRDGS